MKRAVVIIGMLTWVAAIAARAETPAPQPGPAHQKLEIFVGNWTFQGEIRAPPLGPAAKTSGTLTGRMVLGGFFLEFRGEERDASGAITAQWLELDGYDSVANRYTWISFDDRGNTLAATDMIEGNTMTYEGTGVQEGRQFKLRGSLVVAPDLMSFVDTMEISVDGGKTWQTWFVDRGAKAATR
jgi:hypothetical protein